MTALEKITDWLRTFPLWEDGNVSVDYTDGLPGTVGLFPRGLEEVSRKIDVLGNVTVVNRLHFMLYRITTGQQHSPDHSTWLLALQNWIQQQSVQGLAPCFGDDPAREKIRGEKGMLKNSLQTGTGKYAVELTVEYIQNY